MRWGHLHAGPALAVRPGGPVHAAAAGTAVIAAGVGRYGHRTRTDHAGGLATGCADVDSLPEGGGASGSGRSAHVTRSSVVRAEGGEDTAATPGRTFEPAGRCTGLRSAPLRLWPPRSSFSRSQARPSHRAGS